MNFRASFVVGTFGFVICAAWACGGTDGNTTPGAEADAGASEDAPSDTVGAVSIGVACAAYAAASCDRWATCAPPGLKTRYVDLAACRAAEAIDCEFRTTTEGTGWSAASRKECADALAAQSCEDFVNQKPIASCNKLGTRATNDACADDAQCASGVCTIGFGAFCGTCKEPPSEGEDCIEGRCKVGLYCRTASNNRRVCRVPVDKGAACDSSKPCLNNWSCTGGTCVDRAELDQTCDVEGKTAPFCASAHELDCVFVGAEQKCKPFVYASGGGSCSESNQLCAANGTCTVNGGGAKCVAARAEGETCSLTSECAVPLACSDQKCVPQSDDLCPSTL